MNWVLDFAGVFFMLYRSLFFLGSLSLMFSFASVSQAAPKPKKKTTTPVKNTRGAPNAQKAKFTVYNEGVDLMMASKHASAQEKFETAIKLDAGFAEAHTNLAYVLRKQGEVKYKTALQHYDQAIKLKPQMAEAYMYRGVLFMQMDQASNAKKDLETLGKLSPKLAKELEYVIINGREKTPAQFFGVKGKLYN